MILEHTFKHVFVVAITCLFCITPLHGLSLEKTTASKTPVPVPAPLKPMSVSKTPAPGPMQAELAAVIEKISLKGNRVVVLLAGKGKIAPEDYQKIILRVETSKGPRQWSLSEADRARSLIAGTGRVEFDTGILLDKTEMVKGVLLFGKIEKPKQEMLVIASTPMAPAARLQAAAPERPRTSPPSPVPRLVDRGIRILNPTVDNHYYQGETIYVFYQVSRAEVPTGNITFRMESIGMGAEVGSVTIPAARNGLVALTPRADTPIARYVITGEEPGSDAFGQSDIFYVDRNSARIDFIAPTRGQEIPRDGTLSARYQFNNRVEPGTITFQLGHAGTIVSTQTARHLPHNAGSTSPPIHTVHFPLASDAPLGEYAIIATHPRASGISPVFNVIRRTFGDGGGDGTVYTQCDYGITSVTFEDGRALDTGFDPGRSSTVTGVLRTRLEWNRIPVPSTYPSGTPFNYEVRVISTATGEQIGR
ncbi:MAG TPA: hypothetical protein VHO84_11840, partial [Syntrophorhabdaceae bacterium]|nr:hypothetical protein [Syntrophorhabdaceae bacterium]